MAHASIIKNVCGGVPPPLTFSESVSLNKENDMSNFDTKELRQVFSQFPTGVTVITTRTADGEPIGVTASSFNTVSISPTLILWSIDKGARSLEAFKSCEYFAVNILSDKQIPISNRFAGRGQDKFGGINYTSGLGDAPLIPESFDPAAMQKLECVRRRRSFDYGRGSGRLQRNPQCPSTRVFSRLVLTSQPPL